MNDEPIRIYVRNILAEEIIRENILRDAIAWVKNLGFGTKEEAKGFIDDFKEDMSDTKEGHNVLTKMHSGEKLTSKEEAEVAEWARKEKIRKRIKFFAPAAHLAIGHALPGIGHGILYLTTLAIYLGVDLIPNPHPATKQPGYWGL